MTTAPNGQSLQGKIAVVTGSSSGIGRATALALASLGADVLVHARRSVQAAEATAEAVRKLGRQATVLLADLADPAAQDDLVSRAFAWRGRVDVWINNAGADLLTGAPAKWPFERKLQELLAVDVTATMRLSRAAGRLMKEAGSGVILTIGWDQAAHGMAGDSGELFAASKGAVMAFTKSLALSLGPEVRVNCVAPGWIRTAWGETASEVWQQRAMKESALARWGVPEDIAGALCFLASPAAAFITGQVLPVNGGWKAS
ncbi:MAG TPA: SDR family NAD(P)-dependent oxidoreductase [Pirellulales bacterium]